MLFRKLKLIPICYSFINLLLLLLLLLLLGGTDIISCFAGQNPTLPVHRGEIQYRNMGMAVECWDRNGENTHQHTPTPQNQYIMYMFVCLFVVYHIR